MCELAFTIDEYSALEHVYQLSKPGSATQQAWNIKVVTNSWGPGFPFDSIDANDLTVQIIEKITIENVCPIGQNDFYTVTEGQSININNLTGVLANDVDDNSFIAQFTNASSNNTASFLKNKNSPTIE